MTVDGISPDGAKLVGWATLPVPFATLAVVLRFMSRKSTKKVGSDDWCMLVALILYYGLYISLVTWAPVGKVGFHQRDLSYEQIEDFLKVRGIFRISEQREKGNLADGFPAVFLCAALLRLGWPSYQDVIPPPLPKSVYRPVVHAHNCGCCCIGHHMVYIRHFHSDFRMSAGRIVLAASSTAALYRLTEVLLG